MTDPAVPKKRGRPRKVVSAEPVPDFTPSAWIVKCYDREVVARTSEQAATISRDLVALFGVEATITPKR